MIVDENLELKMPIFKLAYVIRTTRSEDSFEYRKEQYRKLISTTQENVEPKQDKKNNRIEPLANIKLNMPRLLEGFHFYYHEIIKYNWSTMTNSWYQNHRDLTPRARKANFEVVRLERNGLNVASNPDGTYQPQTSKFSP